MTKQDIVQNIEDIQFKKSRWRPLELHRAIVWRLQAQNPTGKEGVAGCWMNLTGISNLQNEMEKVEYLEDAVRPRLYKHSKRYSHSGLYHN